MRETFNRLADALAYVRDAANLGPGARANLRRAAAELRDMPDVIEERDSLRADMARWLKDNFQSRVGAHLRHVCDEAGDPTDLAERRDRFGEEALELLQALDLTEAGALALVRYVYSRPKGEPGQEMGGTATTLAGLATYAGLDMAACGETELARTWRPEVIAKIRRKRANRHGRGPLPGDDADLITARPRAAEPAQ